MIKAITSKLVAWPKLILRILREVSRTLVARVIILGAMALVALGVATVIGPLLPDDVSGVVSGKAADRLLSIIANAMLAVTTFSLTVMVTVYRNSSSQFTPRTHRLIIQDPTTQNTLAGFIGAYVYALTAIILRELNIFADERALVLFGMTVLVLCYVVWSLIRWVVHLQTFGSLMDTTRQIEDITSTQFQDRLKTPCLGAHPWDDSVEVPQNATAFRADESGYVQHIYQESLNDRAEAYGCDVYLIESPGAFVMRGEVLAYWVQTDPPDTANDTKSFDKVLDAHIKMGDVRTYEQDPRFGLMAMGEIASKALSPGINDPGTAIDVITRLSRILTYYRDETDIDGPPAHARLWIKPLSPYDLIEDAFGALARDGAALIEVQQRLQSSFRRLIDHDDPQMRDAAFKAACIEFQRAQQALNFAPDMDRLRKSTSSRVLDSLDSENADHPTTDPDTDPVGGRE
ncbi:DUF2254 domain-containing protein [Pseudooctadecabacter jejudonensis]|uniref:DUF2254 domain-containing protein n=1 Tax=Pseudooctadecabacter jejudonensis TaxID=1391910 RepID=A0A1Y5RHA1_9RHOB|nr:DUF2254 domain-containing protein [Pseudooctadecabacter jejudonensis]SLN16579.1 hypothetical protein PSJ8397_00433 [Pseudooctadecabacter jejudonensis]